MASAWDRPIIEAPSIAGKIDGPAVAQSVDQLHAGEASPGLLTPLLRRFSPREQKPRVDVSILFGRVARGGTLVHLRKRELELVLLIARHRHGISVESMCEVLWPDKTPEMARNVFRVNLVRLRKALDEATIVSRMQELVTLGPAIQVDLWEIEDTLTAARCRSAPAEQVTRLEWLYRHFCDWQPESAPAWDWFAPTLRRIVEIDHEVSERLARFYFVSGKFGEALALADRMIARDPLDEPAHELRIRILMAQGESSSAKRELRIYGEELRRELGIELPASLTSLVV